MPDFVDIHQKAAMVKQTAKVIMSITAAINSGKVAGTDRDLDPATITALKTIDGPAARDAARDAWDDLDAAMTP